jgi:hypothetical protein
VSAERYDFLKLSEAEPDLGVPASNGFLLTSTTTGQRAWVSAVSAIVAPGLDGQVIYNNDGNIDGAIGLVYDDVNDSIGIGTATTSAKLDVVGDIEINTNVRLNSQNNNTASLTPLVISSFSTTTYGGGKVIVQVLDTVTNHRHISELLITHANGANPIATEYGVLYTGATPLATFQVDVSSGNLRLLATNASTNATQYKVYETLFLA